MKLIKARKGKGVLFNVNMSDDEVFEWGIDTIAANPKGFFVDEVHEVDAVSVEEIGMVRASIGCQEDLSAQVLPVPMQIIAKIPDGVTAVKDFLDKARLVNGDGM